MSVPSGPFTIRRWKGGKPGAVATEPGKTQPSWQTTSDAETEKLIAGLQATLPAPVVPVNVTPPVITVKN